MKRVDGIRRGVFIVVLCSLLVLIVIVFFAEKTQSGGVETETFVATANKVDSEKETTVISSLENLEKETSSGVTLTEFILPESASRLYTIEELGELSKEQLRLARNEIYARHGRKFETDDLQTYFSGKAWYMPVYDAKDFDAKGDDIFNQFESENRKLIIELEANSFKKENSIPPNTGFADIVNQNQSRRLQIATGREINFEEQINSQIIDHGLYYEVTHGSIIANNSYDLSVMNDKVEGDLLQLEDTVYRITEMETWEGGERVTLEYVSGLDTELYRLTRSYNENFYTPFYLDGILMFDTLYTGSLYFSKNCITTVNDPENLYLGHRVTIEDYFTQYSEVVGASYGLFPNGFVLWGLFEMDSSGLIISYTELFLS